MPTLNLTNDQAIELLEQLSPRQKVEVLARLSQDAARMREENLKKGEEQLRRLAKERGLNWETMTEDQRMDFVDDLIHEDRPCAR